MANELIHVSAGTTLTQAEFEAVGLHVCNSQATGDLIYASSATQLSRLPIGTGVLVVSGGIPTWSSTLPAVTLGGMLTAGIVGIISRSVEDSAIWISGGTDTNSACFTCYGKAQANLPGAITLNTPNAALASRTRLVISGAGDIVAATWLYITHTGIVLTASEKIYPVSGVAGFSVVSTALTLGSLGSIILPQGNMSGAANDAARDALAGNVAGAIAWDATDLSLWVRHTDNSWKHAHLA